MRQTCMNPVIDSVRDLFVTMLAGTASPGEMRACGEKLDADAVIASITLDGSSQNTVILTFPLQTAIGMVNTLLATDKTEIDSEIVDGVAEAVNIVAGAAKARLKHDESEPVKLGIPVIATVRTLSEIATAKTEWLEVPFSTNFGPLSLRVGFDD